MSLDVMKQALAALESNPDAMVDCGDGHWDFKRDLAITALRAVIEQAQEPVAWQVMVEDEAMKEFPIKDMAHDWCAKKKLSGSPSAYWIRPLYTAPRQLQGLTDEEIVLICGECAASAHQNDDLSYARAIEARLKEKNT